MFTASFEKHHHNLKNSSWGIARNLQRAQFGEILIVKPEKDLGKFVKEMTQGSENKTPTTPLNKTPPKNFLAV